jgi:hypothetical protein
VGEPVQHREAVGRRFVVDRRCARLIGDDHGSVSGS